MRINEYLKEKRAEKGLSDKKFAEIIDQNIHWVEDFDGDEEELNGLSIPQFKSMCDALGISPEAVFKIVVSNLKDLRISEIVKTRRKEKYWSIEDLADRIGYKSSVIEALENDMNLDGVCLDALKKIATELELPFDFILQKLCPDESNTFLNK